MDGCRFENEVQGDFTAVFTVRMDVVYIPDIGHCAFKALSHLEMVSS
jgi:hypothetical protein